MGLLWWPWFGVGAEEPPVVAGQLPMGDRRLRNEVIRKHPPSEDEEEELIAFLLSES